MSDEMVQASAFPDLVPDVPVVAAEAPVGSLVPRGPGWRLIANTGGPKGFHRIRSVGVYASVTTLCGLTGRVITESEQMIVPCPVCEAGTP